MSTWSSEDRKLAVVPKRPASRLPALLLNRDHVRIPGRLIVQISRYRTAVAASAGPRKTFSTTVRNCGCRSDAVDVPERAISIH